MTNIPAPSTWTSPDAYEAFMGRWGLPAAETILDRLKLPSGLSWVDIGCGTGASTQAILTSCDPIALLGIDPSESFIAVANNRFRDPRVRFDVGRAESLPALDDQFDVVMSGLVLHFVKDAPASAAEMRRVARPGGILVSYIWDIDNEEQFTRAFWRAAKSVDPSAHEWDRTLLDAISRRAPLLDLFERSGLEDVTVQEVNFETRFRDFDDYWQPCILDGTSPVQRYAHSLPKERQAILEHRLRSTLPIANDGSISLNGCLLVATGTEPSTR